MAFALLGYVDLAAGLIHRHVCHGESRWWEVSRNPKRIRHHPFQPPQQRLRHRVSDRYGRDHAAKKAATSAEAQAQEAAVRTQLENQQLEKISDQLSQELAASGLKDQTEVRLESDGLHITLASSILFASGSAEITDTTRQSLDLLSDSLKKLKANKIVIAGHTDNVPEKGNGRYQSNWDLSSARAITVMEYFISKGAVLEKNAAIQAFADTEPKADNNTPQGRSENRRVEMIIQRTETTQ